MCFFPEILEFISESGAKIFLQNFWFSWHQWYGSYLNWMVPLNWGPPGGWRWRSVWAGRTLLLPPSPITILPPPLPCFQQSRSSLSLEFRLKDFIGDLVIRLKPRKITEPELWSWNNTFVWVSVKIWQYSCPYPPNSLSILIMFIWGILGMGSYIVWIAIVFQKDWWPRSMKDFLRCVSSCSFQCSLFFLKA